MKKLKPLLSALVLTLVITLLPSTAHALTSPNVGAAAVILVDADSGEIYFEKNAENTVQPASTTKLMTALLTAEAVERGDITLADEVTATEDSSYNLEYDSSTANPAIEPGETLTVEELLYCAMLPSANEACNILGAYVSGSVPAFVDAMNARAEDLGCTGTHFVNVNGLEAEDHYTTAADFAAIAREAVTHPTVMRICGTVHHTVPATNMAEERALTNTNALIDPESSFYCDYVSGLKTGFFESAGYCLVSSAEKDGIRTVCVVFGAPEPGDHFIDTLTLYSWLYGNYALQPVLSASLSVGSIPVNHGTSDAVEVRAQSDISAVLPNDYDFSRISYQYTLYHEVSGVRLEAPLSAGDELGEVTAVELDENGGVLRTFGTARLVAAADVGITQGAYLRVKVGGFISAHPVLCIVILLAVLLAVFCLARSARQKRRRRRRREAARPARTPQRRPQHPLPPEDGPFRDDDPFGW